MSLGSGFNIEASMGVPPVLAAILFLALWVRVVDGADEGASARIFAPSRLKT